MLQTRLNPLQDGFEQQLILHRCSTRLCDLALPVERCKALLTDALMGFRDIFEKVEQDFGVTPDMVWLGQDGRAQVWLHPDPSSSQPLFKTQHLSLSKENALVQMIIQVF